MDLTDEQRQKLSQMERILGYRFRNTRYILSAITHPSATEGKAVRFSYERLEFLGDSILGAIVAYAAFHKYPDLDEGGLTRIKVALVSGSSLAAVAESLGFAELIVFGSSETGTGHRGMHSALENVYEAVVAALYLDGGREVAERFVTDTLIPRMDISMAREPENPKSALQEKLQEVGPGAVGRVPGGAGRHRRAEGRRQRAESRLEGAEGGREGRAPSPAQGRCRRAESGQGRGGG